MSSEGTSLEDIEVGNIQNEADNARMNAILSDMNGAGLLEEAVPEQREMLPTQPMYQAPPMQPQQQPAYYPQQPPMLPQYPMGGAGGGMPMGMPMGMYGGGMQGMQGAQHPGPRYAVEEEEPVPAPAPRRKTNAWSTMFERLRDPIMVGLLVCLVTLPAIHTFASKHAAWAYKVGGDLSWKGMLLQSVLVAAVYALYKYGLEVLDM